MELNKKIKKTILSVITLILFSTFAFLGLFKEINGFLNIFLFLTWAEIISGILLIDKDIFQKYRKNYVKSYIPEWFNITFYFTLFFILFFFNYIITGIFFFISFCISYEKGKELN